MKIRKKLDDEESKTFWQFVHIASQEVESWPAWKRGESVEVRVASESKSKGQSTNSQYSTQASE